MQLGQSIFRAADIHAFSCAPRGCASISSNDVTGFEMPTRCENLFEFDLLVIGEVVRVTQNPRSDPPDLPYLFSRWRGTNSA